jgi:hypothetical protein
MPVQIAECPTVSGAPVGPHLEPGEIAAYVDEATPAATRTRVESHLASCDDCRAEVAEISQLSLAVRQARRRRRVWIPAAAAAAAVILLVAPRLVRAPLRDHREGAVTTTISPRVLSPVGLVDSLTELTWSSVPHAARYHVRLFDANSAVLWEPETSDTSLTVPISVRVRTSATYYWKVEAITGFNRAAASELVAFSVRHGRAP